MNKKLPLSVIILCHELDAQLERALDSVSFASEIILANTNHLELSSLAQKYTFKEIVLERTKKIDMSAWRNQALQAARQDWILFLDSDEYFLPDAANQIEKCLNTGCYGVSFQRIDIFHHQLLHHGETGNLFLVRMGRRGYLQYLRPVHEIPFIKGPICTSKAVIMHESHANISSFLQKITKYAQTEAEYRIVQKQPFQLWELLVFPPAKFIYNYLFKLGILDGWRGLIYALLMSLHSFMVRIYHYEMAQSQ